MNRALQWKLIAGFLLVFIAGGMTGAFFGAAYARHLFFEFHQPGVMGIRMRDRLRTELNLTPEQVAKISPIIDKTAAQLAEIRHDTGRRVHEVMINAHREMAANLTRRPATKIARNRVAAPPVASRSRPARVSRCGAFRIALASCSFEQLPGRFDNFMGFFWLPRCR